MTTKFKIAGIGELLWDLLPEGKQLGGAPANFAYHALQAGFESYVISAVGEDANGEEIFQRMDQLGLNPNLESVPDAESADKAYEEMVELVTEVNINRDLWRS